MCLTYLCFSPVIQLFNQWYPEQLPLYICYLREWLHCGRSRWLRAANLLFSHSHTHTKAVSRVPHLFPVYLLVFLFDMAVFTCEPNVTSFTVWETFMNVVFALFFCVCAYHIQTWFSPTIYVNYLFLRQSIATINGPFSCVKAGDYFVFIPWKGIDMTFSEIWYAGASQLKA